MFKVLVAQFEEHDRQIFLAVLLLIFATLIAYFYFLSISVYGVIARKQAESTIADLSTHVSALESEYALLDKRINLELAHARGFVDIAVPRYISRESAPDTLTLRRDGDAR